MADNAKEAAADKKNNKGKQPQDPNAVYLQAAAEEATAKAAQARANTVKTIADAELSRAKTVETISNVDMDSQNHSLKLAEQIGQVVQQQTTATTQPF